MCDAPHLICYRCGSEFVLDERDCICGVKASPEYNHENGWVTVAICPYCGADNGEGE